MAVISLDCPHCGAKLTPDDAKKTIRCEYCGTSFERAKTTTYPKGQTTVTTTPTVNAAPAVKGVLLTSVAMTVAGAGFAAYMAAGSDMNIPSLTAPPAQSAADKPGIAAQIVGAVAGPEVDFMWDTVGGPPSIVTIDGKEHVVGRLRVRGDDMLHIGVFSAEDGSQRYRVGPFGSYSDAYRATHFAVVGDRLVVTDFRGKLRLFALASGEPIQDIALTDRAEQLCLVEETGEKPALYLAQVDRRQFLVDVAGAALKDAKLPRRCDDHSFMNRRDGDPEAMRSDRLRRAPKVDGIDVQAVFIDGDVGVARGVKDPGTAYPMAFGFDPASREVRWKGPVAVVDQSSVRERDNVQDALAAGRYFGTYGEGSETWHLFGFDARTGARLWDHKLRGIFSVDWLYGVTATENHVFVVRMSTVEVHDASTGALKATIGDDTYDDE